MSHGFACGVLLLKGNDTVAVNAAEVLVMLILRVHAEGMIKLLQEVAHHLFDCLEIQHHIVFVKRFCYEDELYTAGVPMRELAAAGVLGEQVTALQFNCFANAEHGVISKRGLHPF